ncbi:unnamed protein product [Euphydryas editha]|uniref:Uncharacterized protein n=1 Tax=Euphydryas editha TaxID=104508 RepID=A0AAU9TV86_EUPED|nr:unnamed protein product [Euphydryas editha]
MRVEGVMGVVTDQEQEQQQHQQRQHGLAAGRQPRASAARLHIWNDTLRSKRRHAREGALLMLVTSDIEENSLTEFESQCTASGGTSVHTGKVEYYVACARSHEARINSALIEALTAPRARHCALFIVQTSAPRGVARVRGLRRRAAQPLVDERRLASEGRPGDDAAGATEAVPRRSIRARLSCGAANTRGDTMTARISIEIE